MCNTTNQTFFITAKKLHTSTYLVNIDVPKKIHQSKYADNIPLSSPKFKNRINAKNEKVKVQL